MSLLVRYRIIMLLVVSVGSACASSRPQVTVATPADSSAPSPLPDVVSDARRLDQRSNAVRLEALQELLRRRGLQFTLQPFRNESRQRDSREQGHNVVLESLGPDRPQIIVGAHLDVVSLDGGRRSPGMVDNASGVIVLTRVAESLKTYQLRHRIQIVFFDMEEAGLQGSKHFASSLDRATIRVMVNVDIAGYGDTILSGPTAAAGTEGLHQALSRVCAARGYTCLRLAAFPNGDDRSFQAVGIPAISLGILPALEAHQVWLLFNGGKNSGLAPGFAPPILKTIHTPEDTVDKLTPAGMTLIHDAVVGLLLELDAR
jgi:Zn-dependent M28 family amino/carboxypeptidase